LPMPISPGWRSSGRSSPHAFVKASLRWPTASGELRDSMPGAGVATATACRERLRGGPFAAPAGREALQVTHAPPRAATGRVERPRSHCRGALPNNGSECRGVERKRADWMPIRGHKRPPVGRCGADTSIVAGRSDWAGSDWPERPEGARAFRDPRRGRCGKPPRGPPSRSPGSHKLGVAEGEVDLRTSLIGSSMLDNSIARKPPKLDSRHRSFVGSWPETEQTHQFLSIRLIGAFNALWYDEVGV
jgi:hypothetical protein